MRKVLALTAAAALTVGMAGPSMAVVKKKPALPKAQPLVATDTAGDGNGLNGQGFGDVTGQDPSQATPADRSAGDITKLTIARTDDGKTVTGLQVTLSLSAAPDRGTFYRVSTSVPACSTFWFQYGVDMTGAPTPGNLRHNCSGDGSGVVPATVNVDIPTVVKNTDIIWTLPLKAFPAGVKLGSLIDSISVETRGYAQATAPVIDRLTTDKSYKIGQ
jgi:hypothetical protein